MSKQLPLKASVNRRIKKGDLIRIWDFNQAPVLWVESLFNADTVKLPKIFGFTYGGHYFSSTRQKTTFYLSRKSEAKAKKIGQKKYIDPNFVKWYCLQSKIAEACLLASIKELNSTKLTKVSLKKIINQFKKFFDAFATLMAFYRLSRAEFYEALIKAEPFRFKKLSVIGDRRFAMHRTWARAWRGAGPLFKEIGRRLGVSYKEVVNCTSEEILTALISGVLPIDIRQRLEGFDFIYNNDKYLVHTSFKPKSSFATVVTEKREIMGNVGYGGVVSGTVFVVEESTVGVTPSNIYVPAQGVLVTQMTSPDMLPLMEKAHAFVTDDGGMLCHAAIVARELKKPCVIGTKIATKVLKTGDLVEVDANKGVVKILKRK